MPFASIAELPPAVRAKLDEKKQKQFRSVFNNVFADTKDERKAFASAFAAVAVEKINPDIYFTNSDNPNLETYKKVCEELDIKIIIMERYRHEGIYDVSTSRTINKIKRDQKWDL